MLWLLRHSNMFWIAFIQVRQEIHCIVSSSLIPPGRKIQWYSLGSENLQCWIERECASPTSFEIPRHPFLPRPSTVCAKDWHWQCISPGSPEHHSCPQKELSFQTWKVLSSAATPECKRKVQPGLSHVHVHQSSGVKSFRRYPTSKVSSLPFKGKSTRHPDRLPVHCNCCIPKHHLQIEPTVLFVALLSFFFPRASDRKVLPIVGVCISSSHLHICSSWHLHICSSSHLLIFTPSHLHICSSSHLLIFTPSHLHICSSSHLLIFTSAHICSSSPLLSHLLSHLLIFTSAHLHICISSSHLHICSSSHLLIFTSVHLHICSSSHLLIFTSAHLHICSSSHLLIFTSAHLHICSSSHLLTSAHPHLFSHIFSHICSSSHLLIFTSAHLHTFSHIFSSSHLLILRSSLTSSLTAHPHIFSHICSSSHLLIFTSAHLHTFSHIFSSSHLFIFTSSLTSLSLFSLSPFLISLFRLRVVPARSHETSTLSHEIRVDRGKLR